MGVGIWIFASICLPQRAQAVPLSFTLDETSNLRHVEWYQLKSPRFTIYAPQTAEPLARYALGALEEAYPHIGSLLGVRLDDEAVPGASAEPSDFGNQLKLPQDPKRLVTSRFDRIPVIINSEVEGGGFANPVTQNIELKIATGSGKSLFQHELTHRLMYEHLDIGVGPAGRAFTLAMTPTWWIEGLPEFLTESVGRLPSAGIARTMALLKRYPDWDRLHSLYNLDSTDTYLRGYITSGRLFGYLAQDPRLPDLYGLHRKLLWQTLIPPFVTAEDVFFAREFGVLGSTYYRQFQEHETAFWTDASRGLVGLDDLPDRDVIYFSERPAPIDVLKTGTVNPMFFSRGLPSAIGWTPRDPGASAQEPSRRIPADIRGNGRSRTRSFEDGTGVMWTIVRDRDSKGRSLSRLTKIHLKKPLSETTVLAKNAAREFDLPKELSEHHVLDVLISSPSSVFVILNREGRRTLAHLETPAGEGKGEGRSEAQEPKKGTREKGRWQILTQWAPPQAIDVQFVEPVPGHDLACVNVLVDGDDERMAIDEVCRDGKPPKRLVEPGRYAIVSAAEDHAGGLLLIAGWEDFVGLVSLDARGQQETPIAPVKDWIVGLQPDFEPDVFFVWQYLGGRYAFRRMTLGDLKTLQAQALERPDYQNRFREFPKFRPYVPPFRAMTERMRAGQPAVPKRLPDSEASPSAAEAPGSDSGSPVSPDVTENARASSTGPEGVAWEPAPYSFEHWFSYPWALPPFLFGPSIGLVSIPLRDEMERYQLAVYGTYRFDTQKADVLVSWTSRRFLERFGVDVFSRERFNGLFYIGECPQDATQNCLSKLPRPGFGTYFHYLRENGVGVNGTLLFRPQNVELAMSTSMAQISPSSWLRSAAMGPQHFTLTSVGASVSWSPFRVGTYLGDPSRLDGEILGWQSALGLGVVENVSLGNVRDGMNRALPGGQSVHFQEVTANALTSLDYGNNLLTLRGTVGRTLGEDPLNLKQVFSPYRTYLLGTNSAINRLNLPLAGSSRIFNYYPGDWMFRTTLDYRRPLVSQLNARVTILFLQSIDFEAVIGRGGTAQGDGFEQVRVVDSASAALRLNMDVKGVKVFPALAVGQVIGEPGWSLFAELAFSDFF